MARLKLLLAALIATALLARLRGFAGFRDTRFL